MTVSIHVLYPAIEGRTFDHDYYASTHMPLVGDVLGDKGLQSATASKGLAGGPDTPPGYFAIATLTFANEDAMNTAMQHIGPVLADIPNYYNAQPDMLIGAVL